MLFDQPITITPPPSKAGPPDRYGSPTEVPGTPAEHRCWFEPLSQTEDTEAKDLQIDAYNVYVPLTVQLQAHSEVEIAPGRFKVTGPVAYIPDGFIVQGFRRAQVVRVRG